MNFDDRRGPSGLTRRSSWDFGREKEQARQEPSAASVTMARVPQAWWFVDTKKEHLAVDEARKLHIPVIGSSTPTATRTKVDWPIPGNADAIRSVGLTHPRDRRRRPPPVSCRRSAVGPDG